MPRNKRGKLFIIKRDVTHLYANGKVGDGEQADTAF